MYLSIDWKTYSINDVRIAGEKGVKNDVFKTILQQRTNTTTWTDSDTGKAIQCPLCETDPSIKQFTKLTFAHAAACKHVTGLNHTRHNTIVNATAEELSRSGYSVAVEPPNDGTLQGQQRLDLTFQHMTDPKRTGADVTTTTIMKTDENAILTGKIKRPLERASKKKQTKYSQQLTANDMLFLPLATTSNGGLSDQFRTLIKVASIHRARRYHPDEGYDSRTFALSLRRRIATAIQPITYWQWQNI
eukprot:TRINITY_DN12631_c1_g2_i11.p1 TRINITY_DN12631_c1_g2~~TRINITY_DN12631_c1_g2_i11.p1  ORF type:complete len:246 (+),score=16.67 TRINITY_DN12631_c1_g2_i11:755-1492(+)